VQTATGVIKGKLTYMAPEQAFGDPVDSRADLYAVGVMLWEAVTGRRRFPAGLSDAAMFTRVASGEVPEAPDAAALGLPAEIDGVVLKALAPKREDRFQTAGELHAALDEALRKCRPVALRDLGAMLADAFVQDRQAGLEVEQALPDDELISSESSTTRGLSTMARRIPETVPRRRRLIVGSALAASAVLALAVVGPRLVARTPQAGAAIPLGRTSAQLSVPSPVTPDPGLRPQLPGEAAQVVPVAVAPRIEDAARREERGSSSVAPAAPLTGVMRRERGHAAPVPREPPAVTEAAATIDAGAPAEVATPDNALRHPTQKPKVQLDPDNPWP
jgi:serine/threonine-protein kinase